MKITEILVDETSQKDVALFKGNYTKFKGEVDKNSVTKFKTSINRKKISKKSVIIHHYPLGVEDQRLNEGKLKDDVTHYVSTLPGSSGASLLTKNKRRLIGVHTGREVRILKNLNIQVILRLL